MSETPPFYGKNRERLEKVFTNFAQDATVIKELTGGNTEETDVSVIIVHRNPTTFEEYVGYDVQMKLLQEDAPQDLSVDDQIRVAQTEQSFDINSLSKEVVTVRLQCTATTT